VTARNTLRDFALAAFKDAPNPVVEQYADQLLDAHQAEAQQPRRGDAVEAWLKAQRDLCIGHASTYNAVDGLLDQYRLHADTSTPLDQHVCERGTTDDCEDCYQASKVAKR